MLVGKALKTFLVLTSNQHKTSLLSKEINFDYQSLYLKNKMGNDRFQIEALTLIQNILRHTRVPVQYTESVTLIIKTLRIGEIFCVLPQRRLY